MDEQLPDSNGVLPNKLGITDPEVLKTAEAEICHIRTVELAVKPVRGSFDFAYLQRIHERLFGDIYDFAGLRDARPLFQDRQVGSVSSISRRALSK